MLRQCCRCKVIYGEKEPLEDKNVTSGYCDVCFPLEMERFHVEMEQFRIGEKVNEKADCRMDY